MDYWWQGVYAAIEYYKPLCYYDNLEEKIPQIISPVEQG